MKKVFTIVLVILSIDCGLILKNISYGETTALNYSALFTMFLGIVLIVICLWRK